MTRYTVERHGDGWAVERDSDYMYIAECHTEGDAKLVARALNVNERLAAADLQLVIVPDLSDLT
jgi:hypothetical protein